VNASPRGLPDRIWIVVRPNGERLFVDKPFMDGLDTWAEGTDVTIAEYHFESITYMPPEKAAQ
jgi:hypothetical protein